MYAPAATPSNPMRIAFHFDLDKAIQALAYLVDALGEVDKVALTKLVYLADREHFLEHGYPITGDRPCAMKWGPVPSATLSALNGEAFPEPDAAFRYLHIDDNKVMLRHRPGDGLLSDAEKRTLDAVARRHGGKRTWDLVRETHELPEYKEAYVEDTSRPIPYELILKHAGDDRHFRHGRPVISDATAAHMPCPFERSETDL